MAYAAILALLMAGTAVPPPDLVTRSVRAGAGSVSAGATLQAVATVRNIGGASAGRSRMAFFLSADRRRDAADRRLGRRRVPALDPGEAARRSRRLRIPAATAPGKFRLLACADAARTVRESRERNNCRSAALVVTSGAGGDGSPPDFGGLQSATTCIAGPDTGEDRPTPYELRWSAATDNATPQAEIVYDIYRATQSGAQDFSRPPTYTSDPGASQFTTPRLSSLSAWYFVVRARDGAGNRDGNRVERRGENLCR